MISDTSTRAALTDLGVPAGLRTQPRQYANREGFDQQAIVIAALESYLNPLPPIAEAPAGWAIRRHHGGRWF
jgi:hypothetical protein